MKFKKVTSSDQKPLFPSSPNLINKQKKKSTRKRKQNMLKKKKKVPCTPRNR